MKFALRIINQQFTISIVTEFTDKMKMRHHKSVVTGTSTDWKTLELFPQGIL